ncbi:MAG: hypothetical protein H7144_00515 [Burkholderiales bacterium]|nr:hypothetical protein [Phycisphaerae bacterium]
MASALPPSTAPSTIPVRKDLREVPLLEGGTAVLVLRVVPPSPSLALLVRPPTLPPGATPAPFAAPLGYISLAMEVRTPGQPPLPVWAQTWPLLYGGQQDEYVVLDHMLLPGGAIA